MSLEKLSTLACIKMPMIIITILQWLRMICCMLHNIYCIPGYLIVNILLLPLYYISIKQYSRIENFLYYALLYIVGWWSYGGNLIVYEHGDNIHQLLQDENNDDDIRVLLIANHQSTADVPLMFQAFSSYSKYSLLWIMDRAFKWTNFGVVSQFHGDYFLDPKNYIPDSISNHCKQRYSLFKNMIIIFPEGGFRYKRLQSSISFATKRNYPILYNVTYPRVNGFRELLKNNLNITHIVDLTICYDDPDKVPSILDIVKGSTSLSAINFHYKIHPINTLNIDGNFINNCEEWLYEQWQKKEALLRNHYNAIKRKQQQHDHHHNHRQQSLIIDSNKSTPTTTTSGDYDNDSNSNLLSPTNQVNNSKNQDQQLRKRTDNVSPGKLFDLNDTNCCVHESNSINNNNVTTNNDLNQTKTSTPASATTTTEQQQLKFRTHFEFNNYQFDLHEHGHGRRIQLSFILTLSYHLAYLSICFSVYLFIASFVVPIFF